MLRKNPTISNCKGKNTVNFKRTILIEQLLWRLLLFNVFQKVKEQKAGKKRSFKCRFNSLRKFSHRATKSSKGGYANHSRKCLIQYLESNIPKTGQTDLSILVIGPLK